MRHAARHLPSYLGLLLPLAALAWLGSAELSRQEERAEKAMADHAFSFLDDAARLLEDQLRRDSETLLARLPDLAGRRLVDAARELIDADPRVLDLLVLESDGALVFPDLSPSFETGLPFSSPSSLKEINQAEYLEALGDDEGARQALEAAIATEDRGDGRENTALRAHFMLAGLLRKAGDLEGAEDHYLLASAEAYHELRRQPADESDATMPFLCELALAEIDLIRSGDQDRVLDLMRDIAEGVHNRVSDALLVEVMAHLRELLPANGDLAAAAEEALHTDRIRLAGRRFGAEYASLLRETMGRRLKQPADSERIHQIYNAPAASSLLVLRPIRDAERESSFDWLGQAAWIGLRLNLDLLLTAAVGDYLVPDSDGLYLLVTDSDGETLPSTVRPATSTPPLERASRRSFAGMQLLAVPANPEAYLDSRRSSGRTRALLVLALCLAAGGGAFFLVRSVAREAELARLKVELVSRVSHDLKTPLALIKMYGETLALGRANEPGQAARFAGIINREADELAQMIDRILDFSQQDARKSAFTKASTELGELLAAIADGYRSHVESRGADLEVRLEPGLVAEVDARAMESAVVNLLDNAVKYTPAEQRHRRIELVLRRDGDRAVVEVLDRGIGIPDGEHGKVFAGFYRASNAGEQRGAGLGLSLVQHFTDAHGGDVIARPRPGGGTIMRLSLPLKIERMEQNADP